MTRGYRNRIKTIMEISNQTLVSFATIASGWLFSNKENLSPLSRQKEEKLNGKPHHAPPAIKRCPLPLLGRIDPAFCNGSSVTWPLNHLNLIEGLLREALVCMLQAWKDEVGESLLRTATVCGTARPVAWKSRLNRPRPDKTTDKLTLILIHPICSILDNPTNLSLLQLQNPDGSLLSAFQEPHAMQCHCAHRGHPLGAVLKFIRKATSTGTWSLLHCPPDV